MIIGLFIVGLMTSGQSLFFPAEKNGVRVLPQRFEFRLADDTHFKVGNISVDAEKISFSLKSQDAIFTWPAGLLQSGELVIRDNNGLALWTQPITSKGKTTAQFKVNNFSPDIITELKNVPFFRFCVQKKEAQTSIYLCSAELYIKTSNESNSIHTRPSLRKKTFVEINGKSVSSQGLIFMQNKEETVSLRAILASGITLEVFTRPKEVEFRDIRPGSSADKIIIKGIGTEPADDSLSKKMISAGVWEAELDAERPQIYLKGEGDIPLQQEFILEKPIQNLDLNIKIQPPFWEKTYSSSLNFLISKNPHWTLSPSDDESAIQESPNTWSWTLKNLKTSAQNRRYIIVNYSGSSLIGAIDIYRSPRHEFLISGTTSSRFNVQYDFWLNPNWSSELTYHSHHQQSLLALRYHWKPGFHLSDSLHGPMLGGGIIDEKSMALLGYFAQLKTPHWLKYFDWIDLQASAFSSQSFYFSASFKKALSTRWAYLIGGDSSGGKLGVSLIF